ncbi:hypothetical protein, variant [Aphanomyces astaci]|uniref:Dynein heavy chain n=1 Tax=Aphanomyces astaci TaxID=112090 RepID=W4G7Y7_APHAT|nr:hypothetical protein, variant [Aphanomyces astaci]ETV75785.1 hypothetical protein, variant [Aphanomyces astaci]|eukprot:XP_009834916.1 hypothetical protein, variant [Aphanomyces astaci]
MSCGGLMRIVCDSIGAIESQLNDAKATVHGALYTLVQSIRDDRSPDLLLDQLDNTDMYKMRQAYPEWKSIPMAAMKQFKADNQTQVAQAKRDLMLLPSLFRLLQYLFTESVYFMVLASIHHLHMQFSAADGCAITVAVSFLEKDANGMTLEPSEQDMLHHSMEALSRLVALSNSYSSEYRLIEYLTPPEVADAVPDGKFVSGMRLVDLLKSDDGFHAKVRSIRTAIKVAFTKVATNVKSFETLRPIYSAIQNPSDELPTMDKVDQYMENVPILLKTIQTKIRRLDTWQHQCHKTQASWSIGFLEVHCRHIISELLERINTQRSMAHQLLTDLTTQGILLCVTALKDAVTIMDERPQTTEAFCEQRRCIRTLSENEKLLLQEIRMVEDAYKALRSNCPAAASDCVGQFNLIHALQAKYNLSFQANVKFSKKMLPVIGQQVAQALQKFTAQCKRILNALETNVTVRNSQTFITGKADFESKLNPLLEIKSELDAISDACAMYHDYQKIMGIKVTPIVLLESARCLWLEVHDVWTLCQQWRMSHAMMHAHKFIMQSWTKNQAATAEFLVRSESIKCRFENKIFVAIKAELHAFLKQLDLTVELGAPYIKPMHWEQVFKILGGDLSLQTFCLKQLNDLDMWSHSDKIRTITYHARIDSETEAKLQVMKARWAATELVCQGLQLDPVVVDDLLAALDDDLMQVQCLMQLTSQPLLYQALATWSNEINYIQDTLELWVAAQHDWVKLDRIFQLPDIQQSVRHANVEFQVLSRKWKAMMKGVRTNTLIQHCVREVTNRTFLGDAKALFERLWKQLVLFLHEKRREFPRFNFVSDRELLAIMAGTTLSLSQPCHDNAGALSVVVAKCFEHVCRISVETIQHVVKSQPTSPQSKPTTTLPSPTKPTAASTRQHPHTMGSPEESSFGDAPTYSIEVFAVHGQHDETISLNNSVKITQRPEGWMKELAKVLRRAMKENLRHLMAEYSDLLQYYLHDKSQDAQATEWLHTLLDNWPLQLLVLTIRVFFTGECTQWISQQRSSHVMRDRLQKRTKECIVALRQQSTTKHIHGLTTVTTTLLNALNVFQRLTQSNQPSFDWSQHLQYHWNGDTQTCIVSHGVKTYDYGYEYLGPQSVIAMTPLTERMMWSMSMAFRLHSGSLLYGETGVSKQASIRELVNCIGALCVVYDCSIQFNMHQLGRILGGIVQCQAYVSVVGLEHVECDRFGLFVHQVKRLQHALKTHKEKICLDSTVITLQAHYPSIHPNYGVFCKLTTPSQAHTTAMVRQCASAFVSFACKFSLPDVAVLIELYFTVVGFRNVDRLTKTLHSFLLLLGTTYCPSPGEFLSVRIVRKIVDLSSTYLDMFGDEQQVVAYAVWNSIGSRISPERKLAFLALLHRHFPSFRHIHLDVTKTKSHIHDQMAVRRLVPTPISTRKVAELHDLCSMYAINVVTGEIASGKSTTIALLSGLRKYAQGEQRVKCFRIATATLAVAEFYGQFCNQQHEWVDGIITRYIRQRASETSRKQHGYIPWLVFDGSMSHACVEPLYAMTDDMPLVHLPNGDTLDTSHVKIFFETCSLENWSPSALSRFGIMYLPADGLPYTVFIKAWILRLEKADPPLDERILSVARQCSQLMRSHLSSLIDVSRSNGHPNIAFSPPTKVNKLVCTLHQFLEKLSANSPTLKADAILMYICACTWTIGAVVKYSARPIFHEALLKVAPELKCHKLFTHGRTCYDVFWHHEGPRIGLASWASRVHETDWSRLANHHNILVANETSVCVEYLVSHFATDRRNVLLVGASGVGKSSFTRRALHSLSDRNMIRTIRLGKHTSAISFQEQVLSDLERRMKGLYGPCTGKDAAMYHVDDMHLCQTECQEQIRQIVDVKGVYHRTSFEYVELSSLVFVGLASLNPSSVMELPLRLLRHFHMIWTPELPPDSIFEMFKSLPAFVVERSPMSLDLETCWKVLQFPLFVLQAMWGHSFQSPHAIFTLGDVLDVYRSLLQSAPFNFESKSKLQGVMLNLTATCFRGRSNFCDQDEWAYDYLTSPIRLALDFDTHDERTLYRFATHTTDGISGYASLTSQAAVNVFTMGVEKFHWHHPSFNESAVRHLVPFPTAVDHVLRVLVSLSDIKSHVLLKGPRGCGKRVTMIIVSGILSYKYVEIRQTAFHVLKQTLMIVGTTATNHIIYVAVDELSTDMRHVIMHVVCDGDIPWSLYEAHELDDIADAMKKLPSLQHLNPSKAQCYSLYRDNLKKYVHLALSIRNNPVVVDACVDDNTSLLHTCSVHIFSPWSVDCFEAILTATSVPPLLHPVMLHIHASVLAAQPTLPRLNRLNSTAAFKMFVKTYETLHLQCLKRMESIQHACTSGLKHMKELIREIDQLNARERKLAKAVEVVGAKSDELHRRYEKQRVIEVKLHEAFAEEDRAYQVMKRAIDDEKRSLQDELDQTVPEIQAAIISLNKINKLHITEMKSFTSPPDLVRLVMQAVCVLLGLGATPTWDDALFVLCDMRFLDRLKYFDKDNIQDSVMRKLDKFIKHPKFNEDEMKRASIASTSLCRWVLAMVRYHTVMTYVRPKQAKLETAHGHVDRLECAVRAATDAWKVCETKTKALHAAWTESEQKKGHMQTELLHVRERTTSVDRISIVFENLKPLLRKQLHDVKCADDTLIGDCLVLAATAAYLKTVVPSQRVPLVDMWTEQCAAAGFRTSPNMLESTLGMEGVQELRAACTLSDMQILINLSHLNRWRHTPPYKKFPLLWDPAGVATTWIKATERMALEVIPANDPMIMSRFEMTLPNSNVVILVDQVGQISEPVMWELIQAVTDHNSKRPVYFVSEFECTQQWSIQLVEVFDMFSFELEATDVQEHVMNMFYMHFSATQESEFRTLNERLLDDMRHQRTHVDHLLKQVALSRANLLTCDEDMIALVTQMSALTQALGNIQIKSNAIAHIQTTRVPFLEIGRRGLTLVDAATTFDPRPRHKCMDMLQDSITKLPMDVVHEQTIAQISNHVTAAFVREALHSLPSELHLGFCCYVALGICAYNEREIVAICKAQLTAFRNSSFPGVHVMADQSSPTVTHAVASRVITSAIRTCVDRIVVKKAASTTHAIHMANILDGSARVYIARDGNKRRLCTVQLLSKWQLVFQHTMGITFADLVDDVDSFPQVYERYTQSTPESIYDVPATEFVSRLPALVKFAMVTLSHDRITQAMLHELVLAVLPGVLLFPSTSIVDIAGQTDSHRPIALRYSADMVVHPLWCLVESAQSMGIREDEVWYFSLASSEDAVSSALKTIKDAAFHGGWVILQDLHHINASEKAELGRQFQAIAHGDITVNANFRLWVIHDAVDALFPACNVKTYFFNTTTMMMPRSAKSQANGSTFHSKYRLGLVLFHLLVANGLHAGSPTPSTQFSMYELEQADYLLCTLCDEKDVAPGIQAEDWTPAQVASILAPLYKSKTADVALGNQYDVLYRWCLELASNDTARSSRATLPPQWQRSLLHTMTALNDFHTKSVAVASNDSSPRRPLADIVPPPPPGTWLNAAALGLPQSTRGYFDWQVAESILSHLTALEPNHRPVSAIPPSTLVDALMFQLPKATVFQHAARKAWHAASNTVEEVLWFEMLAFEKYLGHVWTHLRTASSTADPMLHRGFVAEWMLAKYAAPFRLRDWVAWVQASVSMYQEWLWSLRFPLIRLQACQNPKALLMATLEQYAMAFDVPVCDVCFAALSHPPECSQTSTPSIQLGHLYFRNAKWDGSQLNLLTDDDNDHGGTALIHRSKPIEVFAWVRKDLHPDTTYKCPVYTYYFTHLAAGISWDTPIASAHVTSIYLPIPTHSDPQYHAKGVVCVLNEAFQPTHPVI